MTKQFNHQAHHSEIGSISKRIKVIVKEIKLLNRKNRQSERIDLQKEIEQFEINLIEAALNKSGGNIKAAANLLNLKYTTLHAKIRRYRINLSKVLVEN